MRQPIPHGHITKKLRVILGVIFLLGVLMVGLLTATVLLVNYNIDQTAARSKQLAIDNVNILLQAQQKFSLPEGTSYVPTTLDDETLVNVIAKNQPSVVRIVTLYCADITLNSSRAVANFADTCSGKVGSGSIISSDGYIATSGHVVSATAAKALVQSLTDIKDIDRYLDYLVVSRLLTAFDASTIYEASLTEDDDAKTLLYATSDLIPADQINAANSSTEYAVQLSNQPIVITTLSSRLSLEYTDTVVNAKLVDIDYDQVSSDAGLTTGEFTTSDVALLKATGSFPYITLGTIDNVKVGDQLTAIGFPSAVDGVDNKLTQAIPSITQGRVTDIRFDAAQNARKIIGTTVPIGQGSSGGPALNDAGEQIGLNTYGILECPDLKCYGDGQVRDIADLKALIKKNNITLKTGGISEDWANGLTAYVKGNYADALQYLTQVQAEYPANYLVTALLNVASQQVGTATDVSSSYQAQGLVTIALVVLTGLIVIVVIILTGLIIIFTTKYHREMRRQAMSESA
jgi:S1-C subfamily serine protease